MQKQTKSTFSKTQILSSEMFKERRDLLWALLEDNKEYKIKEVEKIMDRFMKGAV